MKLLLAAAVIGIAFVVLCALGYLDYWIDKVFG